MMSKTPIQHSIFLLLLLLLSAAVQASYVTGYEAYRAGNYPKAMAEWRKVAVAGFSLFGSGIPRDPERRQEMADARYAIGLLYWNGHGVEQSYREAAKWLHDASELDHQEARLKLGYLYLHGHGVPKEYNKARELLTQAATSGILDAQYNLGVYYYQGLGGKVDLEQARHWLTQAAEQGDQDARQALADLPTRTPTTPLATTQTTTSAPIATATAASRVPPPTAAPAPQAPSTSSGSALSLQGPEWIAARKDGEFTVQIAAVSRKEGAEQLARRFASHGPYAYYTKPGSGGSRLYILVQGGYSSAEQARAAVANYPQELRSNNPFPVRIATIREFL